MSKRLAYKLLDTAAVLTVSVLLLVSRPVTLVASGVAAELASRGVTYQRYYSEDPPLSINVLRIDRTNTNLQLTTTLGEGSTLGLNPMSWQLKSIPPEVGSPLAAINGDFFRIDGDWYEGDPRGLQILRGELVSAPIDRACLWVDSSGEPHVGTVTPDFAVIWPNQEKTPFGINEERDGQEAVLYTPAMGESTRARGGVDFVLERTTNTHGVLLPPGERFLARIREIKRGGNTRLRPGMLVLSLGNLSQHKAAAAAIVGDLVTISTLSQPSLKGVQTAIGGGPALVRDGKARSERVAKAFDRHPRAAVGWNKEEIFFVVVDGRQSRYSIGMTLPDLADFLVRLKCDEAMNLDGGGSAELWLNGSIASRPCFGRERGTANALVVVEKKKPEKP